MSHEVIRDLWSIKDAMAQEHGHDVRGLAAYLQGKKRWECPRQSSGHSTFEIISGGPGQRLFNTTKEEVDDYIKEERASRDR